jgi:endonuclease/exonuclease/phosphatase family metal-dependent hydrolase
MYVPPGITKDERAQIFRHLLYAVDYEIHKAAGENHVVVTGDFNKEGLADMKKIAEVRGLHHIPTATTGWGAELDGTFVSKGLTIAHSETYWSPGHSDHAWTNTRIKFKTQE